MAKMTRDELLSFVFTAIKVPELQASLHSSLPLLLDASVNITDSAASIEYLDWARSHRDLKVVETAVPKEILPARFNGLLSDVRVFTRGPDDALYDSKAEIRNKVARGNTFLQLRHDGETQTRCVLQALKKFTGGLGDDDDRDKGDEHTWKRYFSQPLESARQIVALRKANGEAAHLSCLRVADRYVMCGGSKNVHLLFRCSEDVLRYQGDRYRVASDVCLAVCQTLDQIPAQKKEALLSFLCLSGATAVFEVLRPDYQHVEDLSHLPKPLLQFIAFTTPDLGSSLQAPGRAGLCALRPDLGIELARAFDLPTVEYELLPASHAQKRMAEIRYGYQYEGEVLYFLDAEERVIGLLKKKTVWYIVCRAIREKVRNNLQRRQRDPGVSVASIKHKIRGRLHAIQSWLNLDDDCLASWLRLGESFLVWVFQRVDSGELAFRDVADLFPVTWKRHLQENGETDHIAMPNLAPPVVAEADAVDLGPPRNTSGDCASSNRTDEADEHCVVSEVADEGVDLDLPVSVSSTDDKLV